MSALNLKPGKNLKWDRFGVKTALHVLVGIVLMLAGALLAELIMTAFRALLGLEESIFSLAVGYVLNIAAVFLFVALYVTKGLKKKLSDFRVCKPKSMVLWTAVAVALPLVVSGFFVFMTPGTFAASGLDQEGVNRILIVAIFGTCFTAGITEEVVFRGYIMRLLEDRWNRIVAVLVPSLIFGALHILNMDQFDLADMLLLLVAGTAVGVMFSLIAIQSGSIWTSALVHGLWNLVIIGGILQIGSPTSITASPSVYSYTLTSHSKWLTGGAFGIEASVPAVIAYVTVVVLAAALILRRRPANAF